MKVEDCVSQSDWPLSASNLSVIKELVILGANIRDISSIIRLLPLQSVRIERRYDTAAFFLEYNPTMSDLIGSVQLYRNNRYFPI